MVESVVFHHYDSSRSDCQGEWIPLTMEALAEEVEQILNLQEMEAEEAEMGGMQEADQLILRKKMRNH